MNNHGNVIALERETLLLDQTVSPRRLSGHTGTMVILLGRSETQPKTVGGDRYCFGGELLFREAKRQLRRHHRPAVCYRFHGELQSSGPVWPSPPDILGQGPTLLDVIYQASIGSGKLLLHARTAFDVL